MIWWLSNGYPVIPSMFVPLKPMGIHGSKAPDDEIYRISGFPMNFLDVESPLEWSTILFQFLVNQNRQSFFRFTHEKNHARFAELLHTAAM